MTTVSGKGLGGGRCSNIGRRIHISPLAAFEYAVAKNADRRAHEDCGDGLIGFATFQNRLSPEKGFYKSIVARAGYIGCGGETDH